MAILTAEKDFPCRVFDANGVKLEFVTWCDTETGEASHLVKGLDGKFGLVVADDGELRARTEWRQHPAPLRVERLA